MNTNNLFKEFMGNDKKHNTTEKLTGISNILAKIRNNLTGGLIGGAAASSIIALLINNKPARNFAGSAATYGGAAVLGGLAFKAYKNWQLNMNDQKTALIDHGYKDFYYGRHEVAPDYELKLIKAMIGAAKADGHIDTEEQQRIFRAVAQMNISDEMKSTVFDLLNHPVPLNEIVIGVHDTGQKAELFLAACLVSDPLLPSVRIHLNQLAEALVLPEKLKQHILLQAQETISEVN